MFTALPMLFCFGLAFKRAIARVALVLGGIGLLLRLIRPRLSDPLGARRA